MITRKEYKEIENKIKKFISDDWVNKDIKVCLDVTTEYILGILKEYMMDCEENKKVIVEYEKPGELPKVTCCKVEQCKQYNPVIEALGKVHKDIVESVSTIDNIFDNDPFYEGHKQACRSAADVAYKMNLQATGAGEVTIVEKESGCEYENVTQYTLEVKGGEAYLNHNGLHYNVKKLIECYYKCMEENAKCGGKENDSNCKYEDMKYISRRVENLEKMVEEINKTIGRIFEIIY